jgi:uncharacterized protein YhbP (UPF0306 family)
MNADPAVLARSIVDHNDYMTIATVSPDGSPWASPVYFAHDDYADFLWISKPGARHSQNIDERGDVAIVIFDSRVSPGTGQAVYLSAHAREVDPDDLAWGIDAYNSRFREDEPGLALIGEAEVTGTAPHRLYRATVRDAFSLDERDERIAVSL